MRTTRLWVAPLISISSSERSSCSATEATERTWPGAAAVRAVLGRAFEHAGADALARHFQQAEMRDAPDLDAGAVVLEAVLQPAFDRAVVALLVHVDEVDDDQPGEVAQAELPRDLVGGLEIGLERGVLDMVLARRAAGVDVDRDQRLGLVDHDVAAGLELHDRREHGVELALDAVAREQRLAVAIGLHVLRMARHEHAHEVLGLAVGVVARDQDLVDVLVVEVADRALDQRAFLIDQGRRGRLQRQLAHLLPQAHQVFEVALDLGLGAAGAGGAQDDAHAFRHLELLRRFPSGACGRRALVILRQMPPPRAVFGISTE